MKITQLLPAALLAMASLATASAQTEVMVGDGDDGPAVLFDGREISQSELAALSPDQMGDIKILDGSQASAKYGKYAEHGVVVVTSPAQAAAAQAAAERVVIEEAQPQRAAGTVKAQLPEAGYYEIDGRPATLEEVRALDPSVIKSVNVFKGSEAEIRFGPSASEGAVSVVTEG